jgi:hypothetical protein
MKYRQKQIIVEAVQWFKGNGSAKGVCESPVCSHSPVPHVHTAEGSYNVSDGDWIVRGVQGGYYLVRADMFKLIYEEIPDTA